MVDETKSKEKYMEYQMLQQQVMQLQKQLQDLEMQKIELNTTMDSLTVFSNVEGEKKLLTPVASGIFIESKVNKAEKFLVNVGKGIIVKKTLNETMELIDKHKQELDSIIDEFKKGLEDYQNKSYDIEQEVMEMRKNV